MKKMKTKVVGLLLGIAVLAVGCNNGEKKQDVIAVPAKPAEIRIVLDAKVVVDDSFQIFYTEDGTFDFTEESSVRINVNGSNSSQQIVFPLPDKTQISNFRIDTGENPNQKPVVVNSLTVHFYEKKLEMKNMEIIQYFYPNQHLTLDYAKSALVANPPTTGDYDPFLFPQEPLKTALTNLMK